MTAIVFVLSYSSVIRIKLIKKNPVSIFARLGAINGKFAIRDIRGKTGNWALNGVFLIRFSLFGMDRLHQPRAFVFTSYAVQGENVAIIAFEAQPN